MTTPWIFSTKAVLERLLEIANIPHSSYRNEGSWLCADLVHQDQLFQIQQEITHLLLDVNNAAGREAVDLAKLFPYLYKASYSLPPAPPPAPAKKKARKRTDKAGNIHCPCSKCGADVVFPPGTLPFPAKTVVCIKCLGCDKE